MSSATIDIHNFQSDSKSSSIRNKIDIRSASQYLEVPTFKVAKFYETNNGILSNFENKQPNTFLNITNRTSFSEVITDHIFEKTNTKNVGHRLKNFRSRRKKYFSQSDINNKTINDNHYDNKMKFNSMIQLNLPYTCGTRISTYEQYESQENQIRNQNSISSVDKIRISIETISSYEEAIKFKYSCENNSIYKINDKENTTFLDI